MIDIKQNIGDYEKVLRISRIFFLFSFFFSYLRHHEIQDL